MLKSRFFTSQTKTMSTNNSIKLDIYINYPGHCEEAFRFYAQHLGGSIISIAHHQQSPAHFPKEWKQPVMHAILHLGETLVRGADVPNAEPMRSAYLTLRLPTAEQAEQVYELLSNGGEVFMKLEKTFFANRFAMLRDKFGTSWMLLNEN